MQAQFSQSSFTGTEADGFVLVNAVLVGGSSDSSFDITVTPSQQSPVSAQGIEFKHVWPVLLFLN